METDDNKQLNEVANKEIGKLTRKYFENYEKEFKKLDYKSKVIKTKYLIEEYAKFLNKLIDNTEKED